MRPFERAARTLWALDDVHEDSDDEGEQVWQIYVPKITTVIAALHEPSDNVKETGRRIQL